VSDDDFDQGYLLGSVATALHVLREHLDTLDYVQQGSPMEEKLAAVVQQLQEIHADVLVPPERRIALAPKVSEPLPPRPAEPWSLRGRSVLDVQEVAANLRAVIGEVVLGQDIVVAADNGLRARLVPVGPTKRFDPEAVRRYTEHIEPHDRPTVDFVREMRARERF
jgi:antitoxin (DNA-binding transcriptional repressor) of toxin-antitoxin stability system